MKHIFHRWRELADRFARILLAIFGSLCVIWAIRTSAMGSDVWISGLLAIAGVSLLIGSRWKA